jgi:hypothetical protein
MTWQHYLQAAVLRSATGDAEETIRAVAEVEWASQAVGSKHRAALILELGVVLLNSVDGNMVAEDPDNRATPEMARGAWESLRDDKEFSSEPPLYKAVCHMRCAWSVVEGPVRADTATSSDWIDLRRSLSAASVAAGEYGGDRQFVAELDELRNSASRMVHKNEAEV